MKPPDGEYVRNMAFAAMAGQSGCASVIVIIGSLFLGLWLDSVFDTRPAFTLGFILTSIPLSLVLMVYIAVKATRQITPPKTYQRRVHSYHDDDEEDK